MKPGRLLLLVLLAACGGETPAPPPTPSVLSILPEGYPAGFAQVRDCRRSVEHGLVNIVIRTDATLAANYDSGPFPLPVGTLVVKEEYAGAAQGCTERVATTLMRKEAAGYDPDRGDWHWQKLDVTGKVIVDGSSEALGARTCASCHNGSKCRARDFTCAEP